LTAERKTPSPPPLVDHLESQLGRMAGGWQTDPSGRRYPFSVALFQDAPGPGNVTYATVGLSKVPLPMNDGRNVRLELLFARHRSDDDTAPSIVQWLANHLIEDGHALERGDALGPFDWLFPDRRPRGLYCTVPTYFPDALHALEAPPHEPIVFAWVFPIWIPELGWLRQHGWPAFEDELERRDPDLLDVDRASMELPS
jgi:Suppressor of fused protein (SUFU)